MQSSYRLRDALLQVTKALSNGAGNVTSGAIDLGPREDFDALPQCDFLVEAPALSTAQLPDTYTMTFDIVTSDAADLSGPTTIASAVLVQTGAGGAGAAAAEARVGVPTDVKRYVGFKATKTGTGNASTVSATLSLVF